MPLLLPIIKHIPNSQKLLQYKFTRFLKYSHHDVLFFKNWEHRILAKLFSSDMSSQSQEDVGLMKWEEVKVPVPWGHIAVKSHKSPSVNSKILIGVHGWLDNCHSLLPLVEKIESALPEEFSFVLLDLPGHGKSSHRFPGCVYYYTEYVFDISRVIKYFKFERVSILGHSLGGSVGMIFSACSPDLVEKLITLDVVVPFARQIDECVDQLAESIKQHADLDDKNLGYSARVYSQEEALERLLKGSLSDLTVEAAKMLLERGSSPSYSEDGKVSGVTLNRDLRLKLRSPVSYSLDHYRNFAAKLQLDLLAIKGVNNKKWQRDGKIEAEFKEIYTKHCKRFEYREVDGDHHVHLNNAEAVSPHIVEFLKQTSDEGTESKM